MANLSTRIRLIFVPFLLINILFIGIYSFLHWLFVIRLEMPLNEELVHFWLPSALPWIPVFIWLSPRIKLLILRDKKGNLPFLYRFIATLAIAVPAIIAQDYLETATGKLTILNDIPAINTQSLTKYYELKKHHIDRVHIAVYKRAEVTGKYSENYNMYIDVACPILTDSLVLDSGIRLNNPPGITRLVIIDGVAAGPGSTFLKLKPSNVASIDVLKGPAAVAIYGNKASNGAIIITTKHGITQDANYLTTHIPKAWLGIEFSREISNHASSDKKDEEWKDFDSVTNAEFRARDLDGFVYLDRIGVTDRHKAYTKGIDRALNDGTLNPIVFEAVNTPFESRNGQKLPWIFRSFSIGAAIWFLMILFPKINEPEIKKLSENTILSQWYNFLNPLIHSELAVNGRVTIILISLNMLVFIIMVFAGLGVISFDAHDLLNWGADYRPATTNGEWWRLFTSIFLHDGLMHLFNNMAGLLLVGLILEPLIGRVKYTSAYFICGLISSVASIWWHPATVSVGASGAIFGLYGVLLALLTTSKVDVKSRKPLLVFSGIFVGFNLLFGLTGGVDNAAHIGGLLSGLITGYIFYFFTNLPEPVVPNDGPQEASHTTDSTQMPDKEGQPGEF